MKSQLKKQKLIAITGGPCSGKSSFMERLRRDERIASKSLFVPEAATLILPGFLAVQHSVETGRDSEWQYSLQSSVTRLQYDLEETYKRSAATDGKEYIICDRGLRDAEAYTSNTSEIYQSIGHTAVSALSRYYGVIHLESLATAAPRLYETDSNQNRYESMMIAQEVEKRTIDAWEGHPNWYFVQGYTSIEQKFTRARRHLESIMDS